MSSAPGAQRHCWQRLPRTADRGTWSRRSRAALTRLRDFLHWAPDNLVGAVILLLAAIIALVAHAAVGRLLHRIVDARHPYLAGVLTGTRHLTRLAFLVVALFVALPVAPFDPGVASGLAHLLLVAGIVLIGWIAITASHIVAELYLRRFQLDVPDNLLARKHVTQVRVMRRVVDTLLIIVTVARRADDVRAGAPIWRQPVRLRRRCRPGRRPRRPSGADQPHRRHSTGGDAADPDRGRDRGRERIRPRRGDHLDLCGGAAVGHAAHDRAAHLFHREAVPELDAGIRQPDRRGPPQCRLRDARGSRPPQGRGDRQGVAVLGRQSGQAPGHGRRCRQHAASRHRQRALAGRRL